jgi:uncharacterized protein (TIGR03435 family)
MRTLAAIAFCCAAFGQAPAPAFEVASVKPTPGSQIALEVEPQRFHMTNALDYIVRWAYDIKPYQLIGGPAWVTSDRFEIQATAASPSTEDQMRSMLRALLAERFQLNARHETKVIPAYVLTVDKNGPKLSAAKEAPYGGYGLISMIQGHMRARAVTLDRTAFFLSLNMDRPVLDKTKLTGSYDFDLAYDQSSVVGMRTGRPNTPTEGASIFVAIRDLGLRLEPQNAPVEFLIIDSVKPPSEN